MKASTGREKMKDRSALTNETIGMKVAHVKCTNGYTQGKSSSPRQSVVVKGTSEGYGGSDGDNGFGRIKMEESN